MALLGKIKAGTLPNLVRALTLRNATATLICEDRIKRRAVVYLIDGKLKRITIGNLTGELALNELFSWKEGHYYLIKQLIEENTDALNIAVDKVDNRKHILVVDDDTQITALIERHLERNGFRVSISFEGKHALDLIPIVKPDLVLLDIMMPGLNGLETGRHLRENPDTETLPIIIISAMADELPDNYKKWGWRFLAKPFKARVLIEAVKEELSRVSTSTPEFTVPQFDAQISAELLELLTADLPPLLTDIIYSKSEALEIRLALGNFSEETTRFFDLFDGIRSVNEIILTHPLAKTKIHLITTYMATLGLLERVESIATASTQIKTDSISTSATDNERISLDTATSAIIDISSTNPTGEFTIDQSSLHLIGSLDVATLTRWLHARFGGSQSYAKLVVFGLMGQTQTTFAKTLRALTKNFQKRITSEFEFNLPSLPSIEIARVPLASDLGLVIYQLAVDSELPKLIKQTGADIWATVFLTDVQNRFEINYTKFLIKSIGDAYSLQFLVAAFDAGGTPVDLQATAQQLNISIEQVVEINVASTSSVLKMFHQLIRY